MRQQRWVELLSDYECEIRYHPGKANVVADALSRKEYSGRRVESLTMTIHSHLSTQIKAAQLDALKPENVAVNPSEEWIRTLRLRVAELIISWIGYGPRN